MISSDSARAVQEPGATKRDDLAAAAHELKLPIAVALALCAGARESEDPAEMRRDLDRITANLRSLREQLDLLLDSERVRSGGALQPEPVDLAELVRDSAGRVGCIAERRRIAVRVEAPDSLPAVADGERVDAAVRNLLFNAVRHAREGGLVCLRLRARPGEAIAEIQVADDGPGVPPGLRDAVFERYRRFDVEGRGAGSGIGLAIVRDAASAHGGRVQVGTAPEGGALFTLELPLATDAVKAA